MDIVSGVASVTAIITIAAQSSRIIYGFVLGVRDRSRQAEQVILLLQDLQKVLHQVDLINITGLLGTSKYGELKAATEICARDLQHLEKKLAQYRPTLSDKTFDKALKHLKVSLWTDDLNQIRTTIQHHVQTLTLQLNIAGL
jgi:hypothetical protein